VSDLAIRYNRIKQRAWARNRGAVECLNRQGDTVTLDVERVQRAIDRDSRNHRAIMRDIGLHPDQWCNIRRQNGRCRLNTADKLCHTLGVELWEVLL